MDKINELQMQLQNAQAAAEKVNELIANAYKQGFLDGMADAADQLPKEIFKGIDYAVKGLDSNNTVVFNMRLKEHNGKELEKQNNEQPNGSDPKIII